MNLNATLARHKSAGPGPLKNRSGRRGRTSRIWAAPWQTTDSRTGSRMLAESGQTARGCGGAYSASFSRIRATVLGAAACTSTVAGPPSKAHSTRRGPPCAAGGGRQVACRRMTARAALCRPASVSAGLGSDPLEPPVAAVRTGRAAESPRTPGPPDLPANATTPPPVRDAGACAEIRQPTPT